MSALVYNNILINIQGKSETTTLEVAPAFLRTTSEVNPLKINKSNIKRVEWFPSVLGHKLRIRHQNGQVHEFTGFLSSHASELESFFSQFYGLELERGQVWTKGHNWGELKVEDSLISFNAYKDKDSDDQTQEIFSIGTNDVRNCISVDKQNELILEMYEDAEDASKFDESLVEIRFSLPALTDAEDGESNKTLKSIHEQIMKQAEVISDTGDAIATFNNTPFAAPRGRFNIELFDKFMRVRGKTYDFKILYRSINMMFLLDDPDDRHIFFVIYLGTPVRQGQKQHFHLVVHYDKTTTVSAESPFEINLSQEEIDKRFPKQGIKPNMTGKLFEIAAKVFRALSGKKLIGAGDFSASDGSKGVKASMKANEGILFFLQKSLFFLYKPATYIRHDEVSQVSFQRAENKAFHGARFFDLVIHYKNGKSITFSNIERKEEEILMRYFNGKNIRVEGELQRQREKDMMDLDDSESDEDFEASESDEEADEADNADFEEFVGEGGHGNDEEDGEDDEDEEENEEADAETKAEAENGEVKKRKRDGDAEEKPSKKVKSE